MSGNRDRFEVYGTPPSDEFRTLGGMDNTLQHVLGERLGNVTHMCPAPNCGQHPLLLCRWCGGTGQVSEADYYRFAAWWNDQVRKGEMPA